MIMSKNDDYINKVSEYMSLIIGEPLHVVSLERTVHDRLPMVVSSNYKLYCATCGEYVLILALCIHDSDCTPGQLKKHMKLIERLTGATVIFVLKQIEAYNLNRMIAGKVNFVVPNLQMYVPSLLVDLRKPKKINEDLPKKMPVIAQCVLLCHLEKESMDGKTIQDVVTLFDTSYATANRAVRWLEEKSLVEIETAPSREKIIRLCNDKLRAWNEALPYMASPIEKVVYTDEEYSTCLESGVNALAEYTMINREHHFTYAMSKEDFRANSYNTNRQFGDNTIEIWRYDPHLFAQAKTVDKLSLYLALRDNQDERIQMELEQLIKHIVW